MNTDIPFNSLLVLWIFYSVYNVQKNLTVYPESSLSASFKIFGRKFS